MNRNASFSMEVTGAGDLLGMFITEAEQFFPNAKIYDQSDSTTHARQREAVLGLTGRLHPSQHPATQRLTQNLNHPSGTTITVSFASAGSTQRVTVKAGHRQQVLHHNMAGATLHTTKHFVQKVLRTAKRLA